MSRYRTPLKNVRGLGAAKTGTEHFVVQRLTATALVPLSIWFLIFAFVSIGLEFSLRGLRDAGWRPVAVFASATVVNVVVALGLAAVLFADFDLG